MFVETWLMSSEIAMNASMVIGLRCLGLSGITAQAPGENALMISEKTEAFQEACLALAAGISAMRPAEEIAIGMLRPYHERTRDNVRRLCE